MRHERDFLLELLSEEIPARMQARARNDLARMLAEELAAAGLDHRGDQTFSTPRRLALIVARTAARDRGGQRRGERPAKLGAAAGARWVPAQDRAVAGPARGARRRVVRADRQAWAGDHRGAWPKRSRGSCATSPGPSRCAGARRRRRVSLRWVRPLHSIVALLGEEIVPVAIDGMAAARRRSGTASTIRA